MYPNDPSHITSPIPHLAHLFPKAPLLWRPSSLHPISATLPLRCSLAYWILHSKYFRGQQILMNAIDRHCIQRTEEISSMRSIFDSAPLSLSRRRITRRDNHRPHVIEHGCNDGNVRVRRGSQTQSSAFFSERRQAKEPSHKFGAEGRKRDGVHVRS